MKNKLLKLSCCALAFTQLAALGADIGTNASPTSEISRRKDYEIDASGNYKFSGNLDTDINGFPGTFWSYLADDSVEMKKEDQQIIFEGPRKLIIVYGVLGDYELLSMRAAHLMKPDSDPRDQFTPYVSYSNSAEVAVNLLSSFINNNVNSTRTFKGKVCGSNLHVTLENITVPKDWWLDLIFVPHDEQNNPYQKTLKKLEELK